MERCYPSPWPTPKYYGPVGRGWHRVFVRPLVPDDHLVVPRISDYERMQDAKPAKALVSVVDDDESVRESLPDLLRELGFSANSFASAKEFLDSDSPTNAACVILDIAMPDMSGPELRRELENRGHHVPAIFITAHPEAAARPEVRTAVACLVKPFSDADLQDALRRALVAKRV